MSVATIVPRAASTPLGLLLDLSTEPDFRITSKTRMLRLPAVTLATLRIRTGPAEGMHPGTRGVVTDACWQLAVWWARGSRMSAYETATEFQYRFFPTGMSGWRRGLEPMRRVPLKGLDLIRATDEFGAFCVQWWADVPREDDPYTFETVRLSEALERFAPVSSDVNRRSGAH